MHEFMYPACETLKAFYSLTGLARPAPPTGDTFGSRWDAGAGGGQAHRGHTGCHLYWGGQPQKGDIIVEVLGVVVRVSDGLDGEVSINHSYNVILYLCSVHMYPGNDSFRQN